MAMTRMKRIIPFTRCSNTYFPHRPNVASQSLSYMVRHDADDVSLESIQQATERIRPHVHKTPLLTSRLANEITGRKLYFKAEMFQKTGSFKYRGVINSLLRIKEERRNESFHIVTTSSGNHGQAVARAAQVHGLKATIVLPSSAPTVKKMAILNFGATLVECVPSAQVRVETVKEIVHQLGDEGEYMPSSDHTIMMDGAGSVAAEMLEDVPQLDAMVVCCGVGSLCGGVSQYCKEINPDMKIYAAMPTVSHDSVKSFKQGKLIQQADYGTSIADGLRLPLGVQTWPVLQRNVTDVVPVSDEEIVRAMYFLWERLKCLTEPSGAVAFAAVLSDQFKTLPSDMQHVGITLSGGNMDLSQIPWMLHQREYNMNGYHRL